VNRYQARDFIYREITLPANQSIILAHALFACYSGAIIRFRQLSRSSISPCEQFGEHHGGAGGCLASGDSGGICAGETDGGSWVGGLTAQQLASSIGASINNRSLHSYLATLRFLLELHPNAALGAQTACQ